jgi:hypothetical protein
MDVYKSMDVFIRKRIEQENKAFALSEMNTESYIYYNTHNYFYMYKLIAVYEFMDLFIRKRNE